MCLLRSRQSRYYFLLLRTCENLSLMEKFFTRSKLILWLATKTRKKYILLYASQHFIIGKTNHKWTVNVRLQCTKLKRNVIKDFARENRSHCLCRIQQETTKFPSKWNRKCNVSVCTKATQSLWVRWNLVDKESSRLLVPCFRWQLKLCVFYKTGKLKSNNKKHIRTS